MTPDGKKEINPRKLALELVMEIMENGVFCDKALHHAFEKHSLDKRDKSFVMRLVEGTVENVIRLDDILNQFSKVPVKKMKAPIRNILRISLYQIFYMDQVPDAAVCNEAVKLVIQRNMQNLKGFVNGVLRNIIRNQDKISYPDKKNFVKYASVCYSMPTWIVKHFVRDYGKKTTEEILQGFLKEDRTLSVRCTQCRFSVKEIRENLERQGAQVCDGKTLPYALEVSQYGEVTALEAFQKGMFQVQDESSMLVCQVADIQKGDVVLDICAAPGGKTFHAADILCGTGKVISADLTQEKISLIEQNRRRLAYDNVEIVKNDARKLRQDWIATADVVIADLPCSGLGVIGKKCDIKYKTKESDIADLAELQRQILSVVSQYVKPGGKLIFSTCTIAPEENQENAEWIEKNLPFQRISIEERLPAVFRGQTGNDGYLQILPNQAGTDGFFISCFKKQCR